MSAPVAVYYEISGPERAPVVLLSNSLGTTTALWDAQVPALAKEFRVVRYDLRGHGRSPLPAGPGPTEIADLGGDLLALMDRLGVERAHLCGVSIGGMASMWLAANAPERVGRLVACCTSAKFPDPRMWAERAATVRANGLEPIADAGLARWFTPGWLARNPRRAAAMRAMLCATPPEGYAALCEALGRMDLRPELPRIAAPTLVIVGADDPATPLEQGQVIAAGIPGARLAVVDDAAHLAVIEQADTVTKLILAHLRGDEDHKEDQDDRRHR
jgi:3-oxoadipate enol-lactonase